MSANPRLSVIIAGTLALLAPGSKGTTLTGLTPALNSPSAAPQRLPLSQRSPKIILSRMPIFFERNQGQTASRVRFLSRSPGLTLFLTENDAVMVLRQQTKTPPSATAGQGKARKAPDARARTAAAVVHFRLVGARRSAFLEGVDEQAGKSSYFIGNNPEKWRTNITNFAGVRCGGVYRGVDLLYHGDASRLEHDFIVGPGASVSSIRFRLDGGARSPLIDRSGNLVLETAAGELRMSPPGVYQDDAGRSKPVYGRFVRKGNREFGFAVGSYNHRRPLVIDPVIYSTYLGGSGGNGGDAAYGIALDAAGNAYLTGTTASADFPTTTGAFQTVNSGASGGTRNAFITKLNPTGTALVYSTFLGGNGNDTSVSGSAIAVDAAGNAYVTGQNMSSNFPTTPGAFQSGSGGVFVTKLNTTGSGLVYSTLLGGSFANSGVGIAVDSSGNAYVAGDTLSANFPTTPGAFQTTNNANNSIVFVTKLNPGGTSLVYSTLLGGRGASGDYAQGIALDGSGNVYVTGEAYSADFPTTTGAYQTVNKGFPNGATNVFLTKLNLGGTGLVYSTFLGGSGGRGTSGGPYGGDGASAVAVDAAGSATVAGSSVSSDFPTTPGDFLGSRGGAFATRFNAAGSALVYSARWGGPSDWVNAVALDSDDNAYTTGRAGTALPTTPGAYQTGDNGVSSSSTNAFVTKLSADGTHFLYSTYLGGSSESQGFAIAVDTARYAYVAGENYAFDFPTTPGAFQTTKLFGSTNQSEAFVTKLHLVITTLSGVGWHLLSSPYALSQTFTDLSAVAFAYNAASQSYVVTPTAPADAFHIGQGYWIYLRAGALDIAGPGVPADNTQPFTVTLGQGWNLVGDPFTSPEALSKIMVMDASGVSTPYTMDLANHVVSNFFVYNSATQGYSLLGAGTDQLNPWDGAWIYTRQSGMKLVFGTVGPGPS